MGTTGRARGDRKDFEEAGECCLNLKRQISDLKSQMEGQQRHHFGDLRSEIQFEVFDANVKRRVHSRVQPARVDLLSKLADLE